MTLCKTEPPHYDEEISQMPGQDVNGRTSGTGEEPLKEWPPGKVDRFLAFGLSKGSIIFMAVNRTDKIYARVTVHHEAVRQLKEIPNHNAFISVCDEQYLMIWKFDHVGPKKLQVLVKTNICRDLLNIAVCGSFIMLGFE